MKHLLLALLLLLSIHGFLPAQTVIQSWATVGRSPRAISIDPSGNVYTANNASSAAGTVSKVSPDGTVKEPWASVGSQPISMTIDASGNQYMTFFNGTVSKVSPDGTVIQNWAGIETNPQGITIDASGNLYTVNYKSTGQSTIGKITPAGVSTLVWATVGKGGSAIAIDGNGNLYTANQDGNTISKVTPGAVVTEPWATVAGTPSSIAIDAAGNLYTANLTGNSVSKITPDGTLTQNWAKLASGAGPIRIVIDALGNFYTMNRDNKTVSRITPGGTVTQAWATVGGSDDYLTGIAVDASGNVYTSSYNIAMNSSGRVSKIIPAVIHPTLGILYVDSAATPGGDGSRWTSAISSLRDALIAADTINASSSSTDSVRQIWVARGTYQAENALSFTLRPNVKIYGSFAGTEGAPSQRTFAGGDTSILLGNGASVIRNDRNGLDSNAVLDGFKITGGNATGSVNAAYGGGIYNRGVSPTLSRLVIVGNVAADVGGGILNDNGASPILQNVIISANMAGIRGGGGLANFSASNPVLYNVLISDNYATSTTVGNGNGGGIYNNGSSPRLINTTISGNTAVGTAGGLYNSASSPVLTNTIVWGNTAASGNGNEITNVSGTLTLQKSLYGNRDGDVSGPFIVTGNNLTVSPQFVDSASGNYKLKPTSPAIDAGTNDSLSANDTLDLGGNLRIYDRAASGVVDMGAYEFQGNPVRSTAGILYVDSAAIPGGGGGSWASAFNSFSEALKAASAINAGAIASSDSVRQIWVARGTYQPASGESFAMLPRVKIYGSFSGTETSLADRDLAGVDTSILLGNDNRVIKNINNGLDTSALLDGFKITGGNNSGDGAGICNLGVSPTLSHLVVTGNNTRYFGGGIANEDSSPIFTDIIIRNNTSEGGGGIYESNSTVQLTNVLITGNASIGSFGGAIWSIHNSRGSYRNVTISGNTADNVGGGIFTQGSTIVLTNSILWGNTAGQNQGNEVFVNIPGYAISFDHSLYGNGTDDIYAPGDLNTTNSLTVNPQFVDSVGGNYQLTSTSPAINAGINDALSVSDTLDLAGNARIVGAAVDMGVYEYQGGATLPVDLQSFSGALQNNMATLKWQSGVEAHLDRYEVEKSSDAKAFKYLASVQATGSNSHYTEEVPQSEAKAYYRLKTMDGNGGYTYSSTIMVSQNSGKEGILLYPNPAKDFINIRIDSRGSLFIYNAAGSLVKTQVLSSGVNSVDVRGLVGGMYFGVINGQKVKFVKR